MTAKRRAENVVRHLSGREDISSIKEELQRTLDQAVKDGKIPHAIVYATNRDGSFEYSYATGLQHYGVDDEPIQKDAMIQLASQSKLLTSIAALQAVEQGLIGLDDDVTPTLPELGQQPILKAFDADDKPILEERTKPITLRHLLTHTSGTTYGFHPKIMKHQKQLGKTTYPDLDAAPTPLERFNSALLSEPGESWMYSPGLDWIGILLHRLSGLDLEAWLQKNICTPLNLHHTTFWPNRDPALAAKVPQLVTRTAEGKLVPWTGLTLNTHSTEPFGGNGVSSTMADYIAILHSLLANDGRLLRPASVDELFTPQLGPSSLEALEAFKQRFHPMLIGEVVLDIPLDHALGGALYMADDVGRRRKGTMHWGGLFNPYWMVDRSAGLCLTFGTQVYPTALLGDKECKEVTGVVERAVYRMAGAE